MKALTTIHTTGAELSTIDTTTTGAAQQLIAAHVSGNTKTAYRRQWQEFVNYCQLTGAQALPATPATVANYIAHLQGIGRKVSTVLQAVAAISKAHKLAEQQTPFTGAALAAMEGMKRTTGTAQKQAKAARTADIAQAVKKIDTTTKRGKRDQAILLIGFTGCFRRSELAALLVSDVTFTDKGADIRIQRSKTDQTGAGNTKAIPYGSNPATCPIRSLQAWLKVYNGTGAAPLFCTITKGDKVCPQSHIAGKTVERIIKQYIGADFSGHSLRVGFVVTARENGADMAAIQDAGSWKSSAMPYHYSKQSDKWNNAAAYKLGL